MIHAVQRQLKSGKNGSKQTQHCKQRSDIYYHAKIPSIIITTALSLQMASTASHQVVGILYDRILSVDKSAN